MTQKILNSIPAMPLLSVILRRSPAVSELSIFPYYQVQSERQN